MDYKIEYSNLATATLDSNIKYLLNNWPVSSSIKFLDKVEETILLINNNPEIFPKWNDNLNLRKAVIVKQITMFYNIKKDTIEILLFWNNYQNPNKLLDLIK